MKRFIDPFATGGAPIYNDDLFEILQREQYDILKGQFSMYRKNTPEGLIVSGVVVSASAAFDTTAGIVFIDGDFYRIDAQTNIANPSYIVPDADIVSQDTFRDGAVKNIIVEKKATVQATIPGSGQYISILRTSGNDGDGWSLLTPIQALQNGWIESDALPIEFKKNLDGTVSFRGRLKFNSGVVTSSAVIFPNTVLADITPGDEATVMTGGIHGGSALYFDGTDVVPAAVSVTGIPLSGVQLNVEVNDISGNDIFVEINITYSTVKFAF